MTTIVSADIFADGLWTYSYTVTADSAILTHFDVFVGGFPAEPPGFYAVQPIPAPYTAPSGWTMYGAFSGSICGAPYSECGGFYEFYSGYGPTSIYPGQSATFTLTTSFAPTDDGGANDFFTYGCATFAPYVGCAVQSYGNITVPNGANWLVDDPPLTATPLPSTLPLLLTGLVLCGAILKRGASPP